MNTAEFSLAQRQRKKVEALFAELKNQIGLRRLRLRRMQIDVSLRHQQLWRVHEGETECKDSGDDQLIQSFHGGLSSRLE